MKSYAERKREREASQSSKTGPPRILSLAEILALPKKASSEESLEKLPDEVWSPLLFSKKARELQHAAKLDSRAASRPDDLPDLSPGTHFKYGGCFVDCRSRLNAGESLLISIVTEQAVMIGFAIVAHREDGSANLEIIDVDFDSRRSSGLEVDLVLQEEKFTVGVAHLLLDLIVSDFRGIIRVDATNSPSRYVCKSLGFVPQPGNTNPCILWRPAVEG